MPRDRKLAWHTVANLGSGALGIAIQNVPEIGRDRLERCIEQLDAGNDHDIHGLHPVLIQPENFSNQPFSPVSPDCSSDPAGRHDAEPVVRPVIRQDDRGHQAAIDSEPEFLNPLEFRTFPDVFYGAKPLNHDLTARAGRARYTASRLRPFARRRFNTRRPFFVLMRTRNP